ncbi:MAG: (d)CMP kinase [Rhodobacteraceae bacterium]|nr:(d)CMP kinase [Paracoccaceae bacterium]
MTFIVAIDGPAAGGKGTIARAVASRFGFAYLDTGLLYRAVGRRALAELGPALEGESELVRIASAITEPDIHRDDLRTAAVAQAAGRVATVTGVRDALVTFQRRFAGQQCGAILDGRDIGTVICPDADVKLFITADPEVRAERRFQELAGRGEATDFKTVLGDLIRRDTMDAERDAAPMRPADDAIVIDTSDLSIKEAVATVIAQIEKQ